MEKREITMKVDIIPLILISSIYLSVRIICFITLVKVETHNTNISQTQGYVISIQL